MAHVRTICPHGTVVAQCRCPGPHPEHRLALCPFPEHQIVSSATPWSSTSSDPLGDILAAIKLYEEGP
jgi:hypothetical protein